MKVYIDNQQVNLKATDSIGAGGEAEVFAWNNYAVKIFHALKAGATPAQKNLWSMMQKIRNQKLQTFPKNLPDNVISPQKLVFDRRGNVIGYVMKMVKNVEVLMKLANKKFQLGHYQREVVMKLFRQIYLTMLQIHRAKVVIGDFNDLNVLFSTENNDDLQSYFIDTDSMQFNGLPCTVATERFLDPRLIGQNFFSQVVFDQASDYYAFAVMLFQSLLFVSPYGGIHKDYKTELKRAQAKVSVFDDKVKYPKAALPYSILPDDLLQYFFQMFEQGKREQFSLDLLPFTWTTCKHCGTVHARVACPVCQAKVLVTTPPVVSDRGCRVDLIWRTAGRIILAQVQNDQLYYLYEEKGKVLRESKQVVLEQKATQDWRFSLMRKKTLIAKGDTVVLALHGKVEKKVKTEKLGNWPMFANNEVDFFTLSGNVLAKNDSQVMGQVLENQTWFKVGPTFGFGFYRIGRKIVHFIFDTARQGLDDSIKLTQFGGKLVDAECYFNEKYCLFLTSRVENGKVINSMHLISRTGEVLGSVEAEANNSRILKSIHNKALGGKNILTATDDGLLLVSVENGAFREAKLFSQTEAFVDEQTQILASRNGVYAVRDKEIYFLQLT